MSSMKSYSIFHYVLNTDQRDRYIFHNGYGENPNDRKSGFTPLERFSALSLFDQAMKKQVKLSKHITFKLANVQKSVEPERAAYDRYQASLCYNGLPFLISVGANGDYDHEIWEDMLELAKKHRVTPPKINRIPSTYIADILVPLPHQEVVYFMYRNDCHAFTRNLGMALLTPEALRF